MRDHRYADITVCLLTKWTQAHAQVLAEALAIS